MQREIQLAQGGSIQTQLGFAARGVIVTNNTGNWVRLPDIVTWVGPYSMAGYTLPATQVAKADTTPPAGQANQPTGNNTITLLYSDQPVSIPQTSLTTSLSQVTGAVITQAYNAIVPATASGANFVVTVGTNDNTGAVLPVGTYDILECSGVLVAYAAGAANFAGYALIGPHPFSPSNFFGAYGLSAEPFGTVQPPNCAWSYKPPVPPRVTFAGSVGIDVQITNLCANAIAANAMYLTITTGLRKATF